MFQSPAEYDTTLAQEQVGALPQPVKHEPYSDPAELFSALQQTMGEAYDRDGIKGVMVAAHGNPRIGATFQAQPDLLRKIAWNPDARQDTPEKRRLAGVAGGLEIANQLGTYAEQNGLPSQIFSNPQAMQKVQQNPGFMDTVKNIFTQAQAQPGTPAYAANEAYFGTLTRGGGLLGAAAAYATTYQQQAQQQGEVQKLAMGKLLDQQIKTMDRKQQTQGIVTNTTRMLAGSDSNLDTQTIAGISDQVGQISYMAKENPAGAEIQARQLAQSIFENPNVDDRAKNKILSTLVSTVKIAPEQQKEIDMYRNAGLPDRVINKMAMGVSLDGEEATIKRVKDKIAKDALARKLEQKQGETDIETAAANTKKVFETTDPRILAGKLAEKYGSEVAGALVKQNAERMELGMPPMSIQEFDQTAARMMGGGGVPRPTQPVAPAYGSQSQTTPGGPAPVVAQPMPAPVAGTTGPQPVAPAAPPLTLAQARARQAGQQNEAEAAGTILGKELGNLDNAIKDADKAMNLLDSGDHNVGVALSGIVGRGPIAQAVGSAFETTDAKNTKIIGDTINKMAAEGLKAAMGGQLSNNDLEFWRENKPNMRSDPEFVKEWIADAKKRMQNRIGTARGQVGGGAGTPAGGPRPAADQSGGATGGWKLKGVK